MHVSLQEGVPPGCLCQTAAHRESKVPVQAELCARDTGLRTCRIQYQSVLPVLHAGLLSHQHPRVSPQLSSQHFNPEGPLLLHSGLINADGIIMVCWLSMKSLQPSSYA